MGKKRKHSEREAAANVKKDESAPERPKRTLLGFKNSAEDKKDNDGPPVGFRNKEKVLVTCSRRINFRFPNDICSICVFDVHTMEELKLTGNHLKGSCPILTFSSNFDQNPHWKLFKEMITQIFGTPKGHRKSKPYHDHIFVFSIADDHIWFRNYQILCPHSGAKKLDRGDLEKMTLVEVGPRFCLNPIKVFGGSFGGPTQYENPFYVSPNLIRSLEKRQKAENLPRRSKPRQGGRCTSWQIPWKLMSLQISGRSDNLFSHIWFTIFAEVQLQQHPKWQKTSAVNLIVAANLGEFLLS